MKCIVNWGLFLIFNALVYIQIHMKISCHLLVNENLFSYEGMSTRACFEKEAKGNSEMAFGDLKTK